MSSDKTERLLARLDQGHVRFVPTPADQLGTPSFIPESKIRKFPVPRIFPAAAALLVMIAGGFWLWIPLNPGIQEQFVSQAAFVPQAARKVNGNLLSAISDTRGWEKLESRDANVALSKVTGNAGREELVVSLIAGELDVRLKHELLQRRVRFALPGFFAEPLGTSFVIKADTDGNSLLDITEGSVRITDTEGRSTILTAPGTWRSKAKDGGEVRSYLLPESNAAATPDNTTNPEPVRVTLILRNDDVLTGLMTDKGKSVILVTNGGTLTIPKSEIRQIKR